MSQHLIRMVDFYLADYSVCENIQKTCVCVVCMHMQLKEGHGHALETHIHYLVCDMYQQLHVSVIC